MDIFIPHFISCAAAGPTLHIPDAPRQFQGGEGRGGAGLEGGAAVASGGRQRAEGLPAPPSCLSLLSFIGAERQRGREGRGRVSTIKLQSVVRDAHSEMTHRTLEELRGELTGAY